MSSNSTSVQPSASPKDVVALPPRKTIFISRLAADTTENDIIAFINKKINDVSNIVINKFNFSNPRITSSFKIFVPGDLFDGLLNPSFWPQNTLVKEFVFKNKKISTIASIPKN